MTDDVGSKVEEPVAKLPAGLLVEMFSHLVGELEIVIETCRDIERLTLWAYWQAAGTLTVPGQLKYM